MSGLRNKEKTAVYRRWQKLGLGLTALAVCSSGCAKDRLTFQRFAPRTVSVCEQIPVLRDTAAAAMETDSSTAKKTNEISAPTPVESVAEQADLLETSASEATSLLAGSPVTSLEEALVVPVSGEMPLLTAEALLASPVPDSILENISENTPEELPLAQHGLTLADLEALAIENNPTLKQMAANSSKASSLRQQVGKAPNPNVGYWASQLADRGTDQHGAFVEQEFVLGNKLELNQRVLSRSLQVQLWETEAQRYRVLTDVRLKFYETLAAQQRRQLTADFSEVTRKGVQISEMRRKAQEGSQVELLQAEIQMNEVELLRQQAEYDYDAAWKEMLAIAGLPYLATTPLVYQGQLDTSSQDWDSHYQMLLVNSPELAAAQNRVAEAQANLERQKVQAIPNVTVQLEAGVDYGTNSGMLNLQVGAPLPVYNRNTGNISAAYADYCRTTHELKRIQLALKSRLARVSQEYDSARAGVLKYETEILPKAEQTLSLSEQAFHAGELNFLEILIVRKTYFESNLQAIQARCNLAQAHARIEGLLLSGALEEPIEFRGDDSLRGQTFSGQ